MPDLVSEFNAAAESVRQRHIDHMLGLGVTGNAMASVSASEGFVPFGVATIEPRPDGSFLFGEGALHVVQPVTFKGELVDLVAWRSLTPERWLTRTGSAWCLGEDALKPDYWDLTACSQPAVRATPLDWLRAGGDGFVVLDWDAPEIRDLASLDAVRCADRRLSRTLIQAISKPIRLPRILPMEALAHAA